MRKLGSRHRGRQLRTRSHVGYVADPGLATGLACAVTLKRAVRLGLRLDGAVRLDAPSLRAGERDRPVPRRARGMAAAIPYLDAFVSGHSLRTLEAIAAAIEGRAS
jgi:hypothetical protein